MSDHMKIDWTKTDMRARITELDPQLAELAAENERLKIEIGECKLVIEQQDRHAEALSRTGAVSAMEIAAGARKIVRNTHDGIAVEEYILRSLPSPSSHPRDTNTKPPSPEGQQPVAYVDLRILGSIALGRDAVDCTLYSKPRKNALADTPLFTHPSERAVTEAMFEAAHIAANNAANNHTYVSEASIRAALKAAMEAGG